MADGRSRPDLRRSRLSRASSCILPDLEFIEEQQDLLAGIVLTHGHEDHIGAIPYLAADLRRRFTQRRSPPA